MRFAAELPNRTYPFLPGGVVLGPPVDDTLCRLVRDGPLLPLGGATPGALRLAALDSKRAKNGYTPICGIRKQAHYLSGHEGSNPFLPEFLLRWGCRCRGLVLHSDEEVLIG